MRISACEGKELEVISLKKSKAIQFMLCVFRRKVPCRDQNAEIKFFVCYSVMNLKLTQSIEAKHENH